MFVTFTSNTHKEAQGETCEMQAASVYAARASARYCVQYTGKECQGSIEMLNFIFKLSSV